MRCSLRIVALALLLGSGLPADALARADPPGGPPAGPDVASWQHGGGRFINWFAVRGSGHDFAMVKATEGLGYLNPWFIPDSLMMRTAGVARGVYHFARPRQSPELQAAFFAAVVLGENGPLDLPPVLDLETTDGVAAPALIDWTHRYLNTVRLLTGRTPIIYTYPRFWRTAMADTNQFTQYPLWIADYRPGGPGALPGGWRSWTFWQRTDCGAVAGIRGCADVDIYGGDPAAFDAYANRSAGS
jgi:lysozyme